MNEQTILMKEVYADFERKLMREKPIRRTGAALMSFGKYIGRPVDTVPRGYLRWVLANVEDLEPSLARAIDMAVKQQPVPAEAAAEVACGDGDSYCWQPAACNAAKTM
jgi:uncharacterized protein (DUF3820 family)